MNIMDIDNLAQAWISMHLSQEGGDAYKKNFWAYEKLSGLAAENPQECIDVINRSLCFFDDEVILANLAAGPLEDVLNKNGDVVIDNILSLCKNDARWRQMVGAVWRNDIKENVWVKLQAAYTPSW